MDKKKTEQIWKHNNSIIRDVDNTNIKLGYARELMALLSYDRWEIFDKAVHRAMESYETSGVIDEHIAPIERTEVRGRLRELEKGMLNRQASFPKYIMTRTVKING